jgi:hypothetical protein
VQPDVEFLYMASLCARCAPLLCREPQQPHEHIADETVTSITMVSTASTSIRRDDEVGMDVAHE